MQEDLFKDLNSQLSDNVAKPILERREIEGNLNFISLIMSKKLIYNDKLYREKKDHEGKGDPFMIYTYYGQTDDKQRPHGLGV